MQRARKALLANAGLAGQQHRDLGAGGALQQVVRVAEAAGHPGQHAALHLGRQAGGQGLDLLAQRRHLFQQRVILEIVAVRLAVGPDLDRAPDDVAMVAAVGRTVRFLEQDQPAHEGAGVAAGVAEQGPAGRAFDDAVRLAVRVGLPGVVPAELEDEVVLGVERAHAYRLDARRALQHVQLRADQEHLFRRAPGTGLLGDLGVAQAGGIAHAREQAPRVLGANRVDQVLAQRAERRRVQQHDPVIAQPDRAAVRRKAQQTAQIIVRRVVQFWVHAVSGVFLGIRLNLYILGNRVAR